MAGAKEIGSHFWPVALPEEDNGLKERITGDVRHMMSGQCALCYVLDDIHAKSRTRRTAYLPAYTCGSTIEPFLDKGCRVRFYDVGDGFRPVLDKEALMGADVFYLVGYFGFINHGGVDVSAFRARGGIVVHDVTHTLFSVGGILEEADYLVASLRKWFGIPAGGLAVSRRGEFSQAPIPPDDTYIGMRKAALAAKRVYIETGNAAMKQGMLSRFADAETRLEEICATQASDEESVGVARRFPVEAMVKARRENYAVLLEALRDVKGVSPAFPVLSDGVCPLFLPVFSEERDALKKRLIGKGVYPPVHWPVHNAVDASKFPVTERIARTILSIPCDQRYTATDMIMIGELLKCSE
jgi:hypothetical protein